jgi:hypothetical protein
MKNFIVCSIIALLAFAGCGTKESAPKIHDGFELSYWVDIDLRMNNSRGYWKPVETVPEDLLPTENEIKNACSAMAVRYGSNKLYVVYHRQFELESARQIFKLWQKYGSQYDLEIVPTVVLESYATPTTMNFTDVEICELAGWSVDNVNSEEFGIYDVYIRQAAGSRQDSQMGVIRAHVGDKLVRVGLQPGEPLSEYCVAGVEDTWTAECQGLTNELWENPLTVDGNDLFGRKLLENWVAERVDGEERRIVWDMIPVAWEYEKPVDEYGYVCPGDDPLINDPPIEGRIELCHRTISGSYPEGMNTRKFGGYSCDLHILAANSAGKPELPTFYDCLKEDKPYEGYFAIAMVQIGGLYNELKQMK